MIDTVDVSNEWIAQIDWLIDCVYSYYTSVEVEGSMQLV